MSIVHWDDNNDGAQPK